MPYSEKVVEVLDYVDKHPLTSKGEKLMYEPISRLDRSRLPDVVETLGREDVILPERVGDEGRINRIPISKQQEHMADITVAMLFFPCGGLDEAHDIVLPYSWSSPTHLSGPPVKDSPAALESKYCHALVHRKEGEFLGELGMIGFDNACFWFGMTDYHKNYPLVAQEASSLIGQYPDGEVKRKLLSKFKPNVWNPDQFTELCRHASRTKDKTLRDFCDKVTQLEWRLLLDCCNEIVNPSGQVKA